MKTPLFLCLLLILIASSCSTNDGPEKAIFQELTFEKTGIQFMNSVIESDSINFLKYSFLYNGGGVGVGDFNNDGLHDLYFTGTQVSDRLYLNSGNFKFEDVSEEAGIANYTGFKAGVNIIDINNDGFDDIYVCRSSMSDPNSRKNLLFINNHNGGFDEKSTEYGIASDHRSSQSVFFDYDLDGDLDLFIANHPIDFKTSGNRRFKYNEDKRRFDRIFEPKTKYDSDQLYKNNGDGTFSDISLTAGIENYGYSLNVIVVDVNNDLYPDLYISNDFIEPDILYVNNGDGTFSSDLISYFKHISRFSKGASWTDINNDGLNDLIVLDQLPHSLERKKKLRTVIRFDQYYTLTELGYEPQVLRNTVQLNNGSGHFSEIAQQLGLSASDWSFAPVVADFDNDGHKDVFISNGLRRDITDCDYSIFKGDSIQRSLNKDISKVLKLIPENPQHNRLFTNNGSLTFSDISKGSGINTANYSNGAVVVDLNNDGNLDLVVNNLDASPIIYQNKGNSAGDFLRINLIGPPDNISAIGAEIILHQKESKQYHQVQPIQGLYSSTERTIHFGISPKVQISGLEIKWPDGSASFVDTIQSNRSYTFQYNELTRTKANRIGNTSKVLFKETEAVPEFFHEENELHDLLRQPLMPHSVSNLGPAMALGDVNGDGLQDVYLGGAIKQSAQLYLNKNEAFIASEVFDFGSDSGCEDVDAVFFDADNDEDLDLYVVSGGNFYDEESIEYQDRLYLNDGEGNFTKSEGLLPTMTSSGSVVIPMDYDQDGDNDIFVCSRIVPGKYPFSPRHSLLENQAGKFRDVIKEVAPELQYIGMITDSKFADLDMDGSNELIIAGEYIGIRIFEFDGSKIKEKNMKGFENSEGWWNALEVTDLDGDGDLDIIGGNHGLNSMYKASISQPLNMFASDFDQNGIIDPIICQTDGMKNYPVCQRRDIINQIPRLERKIKNYATYSTMDIQEMLGDMGLDRALKLNCKNFESTAFINNGNNSFKAVPLPAETQFAPIMAIQSIDNPINGKKGLLVGGNLIWVNIESGPYDASHFQYLEYDMEKGFKTFSIEEMGIYLDGEIRDFEILNDANGRLKILVGISKEKVRMLEWNN